MKRKKKPTEELDLDNLLVDAPLPFDIPALVEPKDLFLEPEQPQTLAMPPAPTLPSPVVEVMAVEVLTFKDQEPAPKKQKIILVDDRRT